MSLVSQDHIPLGQKAAYAVGAFVNNLQAAAFPAILVVLNLGLGIDPWLIGVVGFVPRIFDAATDPILGYISDKTQTRWGRRKPFIFLGAILSGISFAAMWQFPAEHSTNFYFWTFIALSSCYFVIYTLFATPFIALGLEMTADHHERTNLQAFANVAGMLPWLATPWFYKFMTSDYVDSKAEGAGLLAIGVGLLMCSLGIIPAIICKERVFSPPSNTSPVLSVKAVAGLGQGVKNFFVGIRSALSCSPFLKLCMATFLVFNGYQFGNSFSIYSIQYYVFKGDEDKAGELFGTYGTLSALCTFAIIPLVALLSTRIGKRRTFFIAISVSLFGYVLKWFGYSPDQPHLLLVSCPFVAFGIGSLFTLMSSMVADVCDYDELENHQRREGLFGAIYWWMVKLGMALAGLFFGYALQYSGFDVDLKTPQSEQTLFLLRLFDVAIPLVTSAIAICIIATYKITETKSVEIKQVLEQRNLVNSELADL